MAMLTEGKLPTSFTSMLGALLLFVNYFGAILGMEYMFVHGSEPRKDNNGYGMLASEQIRKSVSKRVSKCLAIEEIDSKPGERTVGKT